MDSIIAQQKIGKRRPAPSPRRENEAFRYRPAGGQGPRERAAAKLPGLPQPRLRRAARPLGLGTRLSPLASGLRRALASGLAACSRLPKAKLAAAAAAALAALAAIAAVAAILARGPAFPMPAKGLLPQEDSAQSLLLDYVSPELAYAAGEGELDAAAMPPAPVTLELSTYTVRAGDSLSGIAKRFGLNMDTLISANGISSASAIKQGAQLRIPNINGLIHKVRPGDNLAAIAKRYKIDTTKIVDANDLGSSRLLSGQSLFIPGARLPEAEVKQALGQRVVWPVRGSISSYFGYRPDPFTGIRRFHAGLDIVVNSGTPVRAAMDGKVSDTGYNANYGNYIILNHSDGYQTLYGHLTSASVAPGSRVAQGSVIGISGNTGYSTGSHLHFSLFRRSLPLNPLKYLK